MEQMRAELESYLSQHPETCPMYGRKCSKIQLVQSTNGHHASLTGIYTLHIWSIPRVTVVNNVGWHPLAGLKELTSQLINCTIFWFYSTTVNGNELHLIWAKAIHLLILLMLYIWHSSSKYIQIYILTEILNFVWLGY